ncbi:MAG: hypothetical protein ACK52I_34860 [Pseudomonadota bacterium]|jgi:hypothetical protein
MNSADQVVHFYYISVYDGIGALRNRVEQLTWRDLRWELRLKYDWYFKYRAALLQVKYPRYHVECVWGNSPGEGKTKEHLLKERVSSRKAQVTKVQNLLTRAEQEWTSLFPIEEDELYKKAVLKLRKLEFELRDAENELSEYQQKQEA